MDMQIVTRTEGQAFIIDVDGEVDLYSSPQMRQYIFDALKKQQAKTVIVNLSDVTYTDSSGIATLVEGLQLSQDYQARFALVGLSPAVLEVFQLARLERVFTMYPTEEEALKQL